MADIKIYGTLKNDTGEPIVYASQVVDSGSGKTVLELLDGASPELATETEAIEAVDSIFAKKN